MTFLTRTGNLGPHCFHLGYLAPDARLVSWQLYNTPGFRQASMVVWPNRPRIDVGGTPYQHC